MIGRVQAADANNVSRRLRATSPLMACFVAHLVLFSTEAESQPTESPYALGEQTPDGRSYPRVSPESGWRAYFDVGPTIGFRNASRPFRVDVVIQTFTTPGGQCTASLGVAGHDFTESVQSQEGNNAKTFDLENMIAGFDRHRAVFNNLIRGGYYHYKVQCTYPAFPGRVFGNKDSVFRVPPLASDPGDTQIALFSDFAAHARPDEYLHDVWIGACEGDYRRVRFLQYLMATHRLDLVLMPGDIIQQGHWGSGGVPGGSYFAYLTRYFSMHELVGAGIPLLPVPGNHDVIDYGWPSCRQSEVRKFFDMMATPWSRDADYRNQWWSLNWGNTHVAGLDLVFDQAQEQFRRDAKDCNLSLFHWDSEQRKWFNADLAAVTPDTKWRLVFQHGLPMHFDGDRYQGTPGCSSFFDNTGPCGGPSGEYHDYCADMNQQNVDLIFGGHAGRGLRRHLSEGGQPEGMMYGFRTGPESIHHLRLRSDAVVVSEIVPQDASDASELYECFKYIPGVKAGCDASMCTTREYRLERIVSPMGCVTTPTDLMTGEKLKPFDPNPEDLVTWADGKSTGSNTSIMVPCCKANDPAHADRCIAANGLSVPRVVTVAVQECAREKIQPGCLRRQMLPVAINPKDGGPPHVTNSELLRECTPCAWKNVNGTKRIAEYSASCGLKPRGLHRGPSPWLPQVQSLRLHHY